MRVLVIDNYDSFVHNLVHILENLEVSEITIVKNDEVSLSEVEKYDKILLSPGPGIPSEAGLMPDVIKQFYKTKSILGVCLGHQALGEFFGFNLKQLSQPLHGISTEVTAICNSKLFRDMPLKFKVGHYHSWIIEPTQFSDHEMEIIACDADGRVMAIQHKQLPIYGVQFHPESILTEYGKTIISNWLSSETVSL